MDSCVVDDDEYITNSSRSVCSIGICSEPKNSKYYEFVKKCTDAGITVPIIPGLKPISTHKHIEMLPQAFSIDLPVELMSEIKKCKDNAAIYKVGVEWCTMQCKDLLNNGAKIIHFYTMGKADNIKEIIRNSF